MSIVTNQEFIDQVKGEMTRLKAADKQRVVFLARIESARRAAMWGLTPQVHCDIAVLFIRELSASMLPDDVTIHGDDTIVMSMKNTHNLKFSIGLEFESTNLWVKCHYVPLESVECVERLRKGTWIRYRFWYNSTIYNEIERALRSRTHEEVMQSFDKISNLGLSSIAR